MGERRSREPLEIRGCEMERKHGFEKLAAYSEESALGVEHLDISKESRRIALASLLEHAVGAGNDLVAIVERTGAYPHGHFAGASSPRAALAEASSGARASTASVVCTVAVVVNRTPRV